MSLFIIMTSEDLPCRFCSVLVHNYDKPFTKANVTCLELKTNLKKKKKQKLPVITLS